MTDKAKSTHLGGYLAEEFDKQEDCDVFFRIDGKQIGAHKSILKIMKARCQGLCDMVTEWKSGDAPISIDYMDFDSFTILLRYVYSDEVVISNENVFMFLSTAVQWKMPGLEELCVDYLSEYLEKENVCSYYMNEAVNFQSTLLQEKCREVFSEKTNEILYHRSFLALPQPALSAFLDVKCTNVQEIVVFTRIRAWMRYQCQNQHLPINGTNMRHVIGDALYKIHFPTMSVHNFANVVTTIKGLLTDTEMVQVFQVITVFDNQELECPFPRKFRCLPSATHDHEASMVCNSQLVIDDNRVELCDLASVFECAASAVDGEMISLTSLSIVVQCWADLLNSPVAVGYASVNNKDIRKELHSEFCILKKLAKTKNSQETMTKYMEFRNKLGKLVKQSKFYL